MVPAFSRILMLFFIIINNIISNRRRNICVILIKDVWWNFFFSRLISRITSDNTCNESCIEDKRSYTELQNGIFNSQHGSGSVQFSRTINLFNTMKSALKENVLEVFFMHENKLHCLKFGKHIVNKNEFKSRTTLWIYTILFSNFNMGWIYKWF